MKDGGVAPAAARTPFASVRLKLCQNEFAFFEIAAFGVVVLGYLREGAMDDKEKVPKLRIVYQQAPGFRVIPVSGVRGGLTPQGLVYVSFFHDHVHPPDVAIRDQRTNEETPERGVGNEVPLDRTEEIAALMTPEIANVIAKWFSGRAEQARQATQATREREAAEKAGSKRDR